MATYPRMPHALSRRIWLRRIDSSNPYAGVSRYHDFPLVSIGNAAARETLVTETSRMAAIWTDLLYGLLAPGSELRWLGDGPGIGRDARIAYSGLLGRYMARAFLTEYEGVRILVPLDVAKRYLINTPYAIQKDPPSRGFEADWIGIDHRGLVIADAKGTFDRASAAWHGVVSQPQVLKSATRQAERTAVFTRNLRRKLPAKRWAIASRWATEENHCEPTLVAWDPEDEPLGEDDYQALARILHLADLRGVLSGLGHSEAIDVPLDSARVSARLEGDLWLRVGARNIEPGFVAAVGPFGVQPLREERDLVLLRQVHDLNIQLALVSLSTQYVMAIRQDLHGVDDTRETNERSARRIGLTVVWPSADEEVTLADG